MSSIGYTLPPVDSAAANEAVRLTLCGQTITLLGKPYVPVRQRFWGSFNDCRSFKYDATEVCLKDFQALATGGLALYLHPSLGWGYGAIDKNSLVNKQHPIVQVGIREPPPSRWLCLLPDLEENFESVIV